MNEMYGTFWPSYAIDLRQGGRVGKKDRKITISENNGYHSEHLSEKLCESSDLADMAFSARFVTYDKNPPRSS
jgi:hypothetical protein